MKMAEAQSAHRMAIETTVIGSQQQREKTGQIFGLIIALVFGGLATYAALNDHAAFGGVLGGGTLASLVGTFVYSKKRAGEDLTEKRQSMHPPGQVPTDMRERPPAQINPKNRRNRRGR
jgi:hypothetical protein